jgi:hypothetical protein
LLRGSSLKLRWITEQIVFGELDSIYPSGYQDISFPSYRCSGDKFWCWRSLWEHSSECLLVCTIG